MVRIDWLSFVLQEVPLTLILIATGYLIDKLRTNKAGKRKYGIIIASVFLAVILMVSSFLSAYLGASQQGDLVVSRQVDGIKEYCFGMLRSQGISEQVIYNHCNCIQEELRSSLKPEDFVAQDQEHLKGQETRLMNLFREKAAICQVRHMSAETYPSFGGSDMGQTDN